jgi:hypothetical protein
LKCLECQSAKHCQDPQKQWHFAELPCHHPLIQVHLP